MGRQSGRRLATVAVALAAALGALAATQASGAPASAGTAQLAVASPSGLYLVDDVAGGRPTRIAAGAFDSSCGLPSLRFSSDGSMLAVSGYLSVGSRCAGPSLIVYRLAGTRASRVYAGAGGPIGWWGTRLYVQTAAGLSLVRVSGERPQLIPLSRLKLEGAESEPRLVGISGSGRAFFLEPTLDAAAYGGPARLLSADLATGRVTPGPVVGGNVFPEAVVDAAGRVSYVDTFRGGFCSQGDGAIRQTGGPSPTTLVRFTGPSSRYTNLVGFAVRGTSAWTSTVSFDSATCGTERQDGPRVSITVTRWRAGRATTLPVNGRSPSLDADAGRIALIAARTVLSGGLPSLENGPVITSDAAGGGARTVFARPAVLAAWRP